MIVPPDTNLLGSALSAHHAGLCVVPPANDGTKRPYPGGSGYWERWQFERPTEGLNEGVVLQPQVTGIGLVCGAIRGDLGLLEFEGRAVDEGVWAEFKELAKATGLWELLQRIARGYFEYTPSGGIHLLCHCPGTKCQKLARRLATPEELAEDPKDKYKTLIETKGEGGYVIVAPSNGNTHPTGKAWTLVEGGFTQITTIPPEGWEALLDLARSLDQLPAREYRPPKSEGGGRPGDDFNVRGTIEDALDGTDWAFMNTQGVNQHLLRPGKSRGTSATWNEELRRFYVFSSSTPFPEVPAAYTLFSVLAWVRFDGDFSAAARWCRDNGYGSDDDAILSGLYSHKSPLPDDWPALDPKALHGPVGEFVLAADPYTEAAPAGVLVATFIHAATAIGRKPHIMAGNARHAACLFGVLVGRTSKGRKGTAEDVASAAIKFLPERARVLGGFGSGEKVVDDLRDDANGGDRRLVVLEPEYARVMAVNSREASILSPILRQLWDGKPVHARSRAKTSEAVDHHVGLLGETTLDELRIKLSVADAYNGFSNRHLWTLVERTKELADGGNVPLELLQEHGRAIAAQVAKAMELPDRPLIRADAAAESLWRDVYHQLCEDDPAGRLGGALSRSEAQVLRLSLLYALLDGMTGVYSVHIDAAYALWNYCRASAQVIFGNVMDPLAEKVLVALRGRQGPLTGNELYACLGGHVRAEQLRAALDYLVDRGLIVVRSEATGGRPRLVVELASNASKAQ